MNCCFAAFAMLSWFVGAAVSAEAQRPNVILIISDDQGFTDYGFMGNKSVSTPHLDRMASEGLLYTRGYATPLCSPSLACLLTGKLPHVNGITGNDLQDRDVRKPLIDRLLGNSPLLPKAVTDAGYLSFQTGKLWNVDYSDVGFTHGMTDTHGRHGEAGLQIGRKGMKPIYDFIATAQAAKKPFFIWHAPMLPHDPHNPPAGIFKKYKGKGPTPDAEKYHAMCEWFDQTCGELDEYLKKNGLWENTAVLYLADNGWNAEHGYKGIRAKLSPYELGIRTPMFIRWPGKVQALRDDKTLASIIDFMPTILNITGAKGADGLPGIDLRDRDAMKARKTVFVEAYTHDIADLEDPAKSLVARVVIDGWSKLIIPGVAKASKPFGAGPDTAVLYDLKADPFEKTNLAAAKPEEVKRLMEIQNAAWSAK
jgi:uncharacterized sulfatase